MYASLADARVPLCMPECQASISLVGSDCVTDVLNASPRPFAGNEQIYVSDVGHAPHDQTLFPRPRRPLAALGYRASPSSAIHPTLVFA